MFERVSEKQSGAQKKPMTRRVSSFQADDGDSKAKTCDEKKAPITIR